MTTVHWILSLTCELAALLTLGVDWYQTVAIQRAGHVEANPIMGAHPSDGVIAVYFAACFAAELLVFGLVGGLWDPFAAAVWATGWALVEAYTVGWNRSRGFGP